MPRPAALRLLALIATLAIGCTPRDGSPNPEGATPREPVDHASPTTSSEAAPRTRAIALAPRETPPSHLVVFLHGVGADAASFVDLAQSIAPALPRAELLVPDALEPFDRSTSGRQWFSLRDRTDEVVSRRLGDGARAVSRWLDAELRRRELDGTKLALVGFSQGAMVAGWLAVHRNPRPAAVVMLSGMLAFDDAPEVGAATPVLLTHGDRDDVISINRMEPSAALLAARGARPTTKVYPGLAHRVDERVLGDVRQFLAASLR
jgi:phospholipase/carboxylesterase